MKMTCILLNQTEELVLQKTVKNVLSTFVLLALSLPSYASLNASKSSENKSERHVVQQKIKKVYNQWAGTRYKLGGTSKSGIDCSAFVGVVIKDSLNVRLPRATSGQKNVGKSIPKSALKAGDLVFFRGNKHVGVYVGNNKFIHSSSKKGVTMGDLSNNYYSKVYTQSRRII